MRLAAIFISIASLAVLIYAIVFLNSCGAPTKTQVVQVTTTSLTCKQHLEQVLLTAPNCPWAVESLENIIRTDPACADAGQYGGWKCVPRDGGIYDGSIRQPDSR